MLRKGARRGWLRLQLAHLQRAFASQRRGSMGLGFGAGRSRGWLARMPLWQRVFGSPACPSPDKQCSSRYLSG